MYQTPLIVFRSKRWDEFSFIKENMGFNIFPIFLFILFYCFYVPNFGTIFYLVAVKDRKRPLG